MAATSLAFRLLGIDAGASDSLDGVGGAASAAAGRLGELGTTGIAALTGIAGIGAGIAATFMDALNFQDANARLQAQLGLTAQDAKRFGHIAGDVYAGGWGEGIEGVNDAIASVTRYIGEGSDEWTRLATTKAIAIADVFGEESSRVASAVGQMLNTGMAQSADEAFDVIVTGMQGPANKAEDLLDSVNEYSAGWAKAGIDGKTAIGLITQAMGAGARDSDQVADALGQFGERAMSGSQPVLDAFKSIGLNADVMGSKLQAGGSSASEALSMTLGALRGTTDQTTRLNAATALFGDPAAVMRDALLAMDPATAAAAGGMDGAAGAAGRLTDTMGSTASANLESFKRQVQTALVDMLGNKVVPAVTTAATWLSAHFGPALDDVGSFVRDTAVPALRDLASWIQRNQQPIMIVAGVITGLLLPALTVLGVRALISGAQTVAAFVMMSASSVAGAATNVASLTMTGLRWAWAGLQAMASAVRMAAAWLIAIGPIALVIAAVVGIVVLIIRYWDEIKAATAAAWSAFTGFVVGGAQAVLGWLRANWPLLLAILTGPIGIAVLTIVKHWDSITNGVKSMYYAVVGWFGGLPGAIKGALFGATTWLYQIGRDAIQGMINGVGSMAKALLDKAKSIVTAPIDAAKGWLGIDSPSTVWRDEIGQWIPAGLAEGIADGTGMVGKSAAALAATASPPGGMSFARPAATAGTVNVYLSFPGVVFGDTGEVVDRLTGPIRLGIRQALRDEGRPVTV